MPSPQLQPFLGALVADALAMPVHWYYDRRALQRNYGHVEHFVAPKNPHADSILWRSAYTPLNERGEILHEQAKYWGQRGVHYHQFLRAGENTLNFQLAVELYEQVRSRNRYESAAWLDFYIEFMLAPGHHRDTYLEEYHREFFTNYALGKAPASCGIEDIHVGGLAPVPALVAALWPDMAAVRAAVQQHVALTHRSPEVLAAADVFVRILSRVLDGEAVRPAIERQASEWVSGREMELWSRNADEVVVGERLSPACYIKDAFCAALYLAWKYHDDFSAGIIANTNVGGDNCHRGAVVGAILGAAHGVPPRWTEGLLAFTRLAGPVTAE
jgi:ADP-ribosyl-[dinitrogen reductase] hydrolase